jgi:hypothetical protein
MRPMLCDRTPKQGRLIQLLATSRSLVPKDHKMSKNGRLYP